MPLAHPGILTSALCRAANAVVESEEVRTALKDAIDDLVHRALARDEDLLTAMVFSRLRYLPSALAWSLVVAPALELRGRRPLIPGGSFVTHLWPSFRDRLEQKNVKPDVVWESPRVVLGIEVKWGDTQKSDQLDREHRALAAAYPDHEVTLLALGGLGESRRRRLVESSSCPRLLALDWKDFARATTEALGRRQDPALEAVLEDLVSMLAMRMPLLRREPAFFESLPRTSLSVPGAWLRNSRPHLFCNSLPDVNLTLRPWKELDL